MPRVKLTTRLVILTLAAIALALPARAQTGPVQRVQPADGSREVWIGSRIVLDFDRDMDRASVQASLVLTPSIAGHFEWPVDNRRHVEFVPRDLHPARQAYSATLKAGILDAAGAVALEQRFDWRFETGHPNAQPRFSPYLPVQHLRSSGPRGLAIQPGYPRAIFAMRLFALDEPDFAARYLKLAAGAQPDPSALDPLGLSPIRAWQAAVDATDAPAFIPLPAETPPGLYLVEAGHPQLAPARQLLVVSDYALTAKTGRKGLLAWLSAMPEGRPAPGARLQVYDDQGQAGLQQLADAEGLVRLAERGDAALLLARFEGQPAALGLDGWWYNGGYYGARGSKAALPQALELAAHVHSDRPIYRPGHVVHWKAVLQQVTDDGFAPIGTGEPVAVTLRDAAGNAIDQRIEAADGFGSVHGQLALGDDVGLGVWHIEVQARGRTFVGSFQVEDYVKPDFEVTVEPDADFYIKGDTAQVAVQADYYFGKPVAGGELSLRVYDNRWWSRNRPLAEQSGLLDETGRFTLTVALPLQAERDGGYRSTDFTVEAEVLDASRRPVYATARLPVHPAAFALSARTRRYGSPLGQPVEVDLRTLGHDGIPAAGRSIEVVATRAYWYRENQPISERQRLTSDAEGRATARFTQLDVGWYRIEARALDDAGREVRASSYTWLYSASRPWYWSGGLEIEADGGSYAPGDRVRLLVKSPYTTTALITLERDEVIAERVVELVGATTVDFPITADMAPGVTARVLVWEPVARSGNRYSEPAAEGRMIAAQTQLRVAAEDRRLRVEVLPDRAEAGPGEPLGIRLRVRDAQGQPVQAQIALALVDKAVLALAEDPAGDIFDALWRFRASTVAGHDGLTPSQWWVRYEYDRSKGYWGPSDPSPAPSSSPPTASPAPSATQAPGAPEPDDAAQAQPRRALPDTAYWNAVLETDAGGELRVTLTLPDSLTTWQALARAVDRSGRAGQATAEIVVSKPVIAEPALPRFVVQGDQLVLDVLSRNYASPSDLEAFVTLDSPGLIQLNPGTRSLALPFNQTRVARWSAVAAGVGRHELTAWLRTPMGDDGIAVPLEVQPFTVPERFGFSGALSSGAVTERFAVPFEAHPDDSELELLLSPSLAASILDGLEGLVGYPYGCVEQTMSRMLPNAVVGRLLIELDLDAPELEARLPELMRVGLQKLYGFQNGDGSWGWWQGGGNSYITAYVLQGLWLSKQAGYPVDDAVLDRGFAALARLLSAEANPRLSAYGLFVMAEAGRDDALLARQTYARRGGFDAFALGALALALDSAGEADLAANALSELVDKVDERGATASWPRGAATSWDYHSWRTMSSDTKNTAMALLALARLDPQSPLAPKALRWLMDQRQGRYWGWSTHDTAWTVLALTDWVVASGELTESYDWRVTLDGRELAAGRHVPGPIATLPPIRVSGAALSPGPHRLELSKTAGGTLYYSGAGRLALYYPDFQAAAAAGSGIALTREYLPIEGRAGAEGWQTGDLIDVRLNLTTSQDLHYVLVEDWLPAGFEAVNTALDTETQRLPSGERPWWRWWGYERRELRDERVTFFSSWLRAGTHRFEYAVRAVTPGRFGARPAEAYAMYRPELWGRSTSERVDVATKQVAERPFLSGDFDRDCRLTDFDAALVAADWAEGRPRRDLDGDRRLDVVDIALAGAHAGLVCGDAVPAPPPAAGTLPLRLQAPARIVRGEAFAIEIGLDAEASLGAWELGLALPAGAFDLLGLTPGEALEAAGVRTLGPSAAPADAGATTGPTPSGDTIALRLGGFVPGGTRLPTGTVLARLELRALTDAPAEIAVRSAAAAGPDGARLTVSADGTLVEPEPWQPATRLWLPWLDRADRLR
ncbi:MAG: Ig-like domain-containing protein [Chloroflexi bacterium]|nr:Ig-like domain-containing protein [Chloroflexota bacterium]